MSRTRRSIATAAAVGTVLTGGAAGILALSGSAHAADSTSTTAAAASAATTATTDAPGSARAQETPLAGDELTKATAAAQAAEAGATIVRAETDADGDAFEVHVTKADGTQATVKLNSDFTVKTVEADQGHGGKGGGGRGRHGQGTAPANGATTTPTSGG